MWKRVINVRKVGICSCSEGKEDDKTCSSVSLFPTYSMISFVKRNCDDIADGSGVAGSFFIMGGEVGAFVVKPKDDNLSGMFGEQKENYSDC